MADPALEEFQHACKEVELLGRHPPGIHCRLCEEVPIRTIIAALPVLTDRQVRRALEEVEREIEQRNLKIKERWADLHTRLQYALQSRGKSIRWLWDRLRLTPGLPTSYATVHSYVSGKTIPTPAWLHHAAIELKVDFAWLAEAKGRPPDFGVSVDD